MSTAERKRDELRKKQDHDHGEIKTARAQRKHLKHKITRLQARLKKRHDRIHKLNKRIRRQHRHHSHGATVMYDSVTVSEIPRDPDVAAAGYVNGIYTTWPEIQSGPWKNKLSIAVTSSANADCLDVEPGDAVNSQAPDWVKRQHKRKVKRPVVYTSVSNAQALVNILASAGIDRKHFRLWTAHYTFNAHICGPSCGYGLRAPADATQWTDHSQGRNLDESLVAGDFF